MSQAEELQCPITLESPPTVPVVTACGHIFSLPAIVHCMLDAGGDGLTRAALCPLCFTPISARDLRLVSVRTVAPPPAPGEPVSLVLLRRARDTIIPHPVAAPTLGGEAAAACAAAPLAAHKYAKFVEVADALPTLRAAATELAHYAAIIVAGGGLEAEVEGPSLFKSMDLLAGQARTWTVRRLEARSSSAGAIVGAEVVDPKIRAAGLEAELSVRDVFEVQMADERTRAARAAEAEEESRRAQQDAAARNAVFPQLGGGGDGGGVMPHGVWGGTAAPDDTSDSGDVAEALQFDLDDGGGNSRGVEVAEAARRSGDGAVSGSPATGSLEESMRLLGTSPNTGLSVNQVNEGVFFLYQAEDGQWLFLHPINVRPPCLPMHALDACPACVRTCGCDTVGTFVRQYHLRRRLMQRHAGMRGSCTSAHSHCPSHGE